MSPSQSLSAAFLSLAKDSRQPRSAGVSRRGSPKDRSPVAAAPNTGPLPKAPPRASAKHLNGKGYAPRAPPTPARYRKSARPGVRAKAEPDCDTSSDEYLTDLTYKTRRSREANPQRLVPEKAPPRASASAFSSDSSDVKPGSCAAAGLAAEAAGGEVGAYRGDGACFNPLFTISATVSYTHLTLPTILLV